MGAVFAEDEIRGVSSFDSIVPLSSKFMVATMAIAMAIHQGPGLAFYRDPYPSRLCSTDYKLQHGTHASICRGAVFHLPPWLKREGRRYLSLRLGVGLFECRSIMIKIKLLE